MQKFAPAVANKSACTGCILPCALNMLLQDKRSERVRPNDGISNTDLGTKHLGWDGSAGCEDELSVAMAQELWWLHKS